MFQFRGQSFGTAFVGIAVHNINNEHRMEVQELERMINAQERTVGLSMPSLMRKVYVWMSLALVISGITAYGVASSPALLQMIYGNTIVMIGIVVAEFALVIGINAAINKISLQTATLLFILYSVLTGAMLASIFVIYTATSVAKVFFITAGTFAATAIYGSTTRRDLSKMGSLLVMALIGLIIASVVNMFIKNTGFDLVLSYVGVIIFVGLTAWDTQKIKNWLATGTFDGETGQKVALIGALSLYLDFINLFLYLLRIFGSKNE